MQTLLALAIAMLAGLIMSRITKLWNLPAVTAYLVAGILIGPYCLGRLGIEGVGFISHENLESFKIISDAALGFIAFAMGSEFRLTELKKTGKQAIIIAIFQAVVATVFVDVALAVVHFAMPDRFPLSCAITLGAIATATAPAATLMVVKQYKADGPLTKMLLPVVALDDVVGLVIFAISFGIAKALEQGHLDIISIIVNPIVEVVASLVLGALLGFVFNFTEQFFHSRSKRLTISVTFIFLAVSISMTHFNIGPVEVGFSSLLVCMMLGTIFCNLCDFSEELMDRMDRWTAPLLILFFVISGAELELATFKDLTVVLIGVVYIVFRCIGKYFGALASAKASKCSPTIVKYLGITLFPQAGVALGMALKAEQLGAEGFIVANITLFSVLIYELVGPFLTKMALLKAGEINPEEKVSARSVAAEANNNK